MGVDGTSAGLNSIVVGGEGLGEVGKDSMVKG